jgi:hypothetical protein
MMRYVGRDRVAYSEWLEFSKTGASVWVHGFYVARCGRDMRFLRARRRGR